MRLVLAAILATLTLTQPTTIFVFEAPFYVNLHHFLYVLGRAENRAPDRERRAVAGAPNDQSAALSTLTADEQAAWRSAVTEYANTWSKKDTVFDDTLVKFTQSLVRATSAPNETLRRVEPIYRKAWWPSHARANDARIKEMNALLEKYGEAVLSFVTSRYGESWPREGYPVNVSGYTNWAGAYSTDDRLLVVSSLDSGQAGLPGLETLFHESMHQWDGAMQARLKAAAARTETKLPDNLSHALIFYTAGEAVRSVVVDYTTYADAQGVWGRGMSTIKPVLDAHWKPYLAGPRPGGRSAGTASLDAALDAILRQLQ